MKVLSFYPATLFIDGEEIVLRIKRMDMAEHSEFSTRFAKVGTPTYVRFTSRASSGPEQEQNDEGEYLIPFEAIAEKRLAEMNPKKRVQYEAALKTDEALAKEFLVYTAEQFVTVERGLIEEGPDGTEKSVTAGVDFLRIFGARRDVLQQMLEAVRQENELNAEQKKTWRSLADSSNSSIEPKRDQVGQKPETIATPAETEDSASKEGVKPTITETNRSGLTDRSSSNAAQSSV